MFEQCVLKFAANYGEAFRNVINTKLQVEYKSRLEQAVVIQQTRMKQLQQQQMEEQVRREQQLKAQATKGKSGSKKKTKAWYMRRGLQ